VTMTQPSAGLTDLHSTVEEAIAGYVSANPASARRHREAQRVMPGGNTRTVLHFEPFPLTFDHGEGPYLWSIDGARYTDFLGDFTAGLYGHSDPQIIAAVHSALSRGISFGGTNSLEHQLAELLCSRFPSMDLVRFTNSGTEANLMSLALALHVTGQRRVLTFRGAYHGGVLAFGDEPSPTNVPHDFVLGDYNDVEGTREIIRSNSDVLAAILVEPMLGSGGCIPATPEFLRILREEASSCGAILIFDEVMTSRLAPGGVQQLENVIPDLTTLGKYLAGGMSFGAFGGRHDLMKHFDPSSPSALAHAGTFNNNVVSMSAGIAGLSQVLTDRALADVNARGDRLRQGINDVAARHDVALHASGRGSLMTIHPATRSIVFGTGLGRAQALARELIFFDLIEAGHWTARRGMITLSLPITDDHCRAFLAAFDTIIENRGPLLRRHLGPATGSVLPGGARES
jgi:glutamate-1-semialdehyde 2,1-aminomutase